MSNPRQHIDDNKKLRKRIEELEILSRKLIATTEYTVSTHRHAGRQYEADNIEIARNQLQQALKEKS